MKTEIEELRAELARVREEHWSVNADRDRLWKERDAAREKLKACKCGAADASDH